MHPFEAAIGEYFLEVSPPAENIAKSNPSSKDDSVNSFVIYSFPKKLIFVPADFLEQNRKVYKQVIEILNKEDKVKKLGVKHD